MTKGQRGQWTPLNYILPRYTRTYDHTVAFTFGSVKKHEVGNVKLVAATDYWKSTLAITEASQNESF